MSKTRNEEQKAKARLERLSALKIDPNDDFLANIPPDKIIIDYIKDENEDRGIEYKRWVTYRNSIGEKIKALRKFSGIFRLSNSHDPYIKNGLLAANREAIYYQVDYNYYTKRSQATDAYGATTISEIKKDDDNNSGKSLLDVEENKKRARRVLFKLQILKEVFTSQSEVGEAVLTLSSYVRKVYQKKDGDLKYAPASKKVEVKKKLFSYNFPPSDVIFNVLIENTDISPENIIADETRLVWVDVDSPFHSIVKRYTYLENLRKIYNIITTDLYLYIDVCKKFFSKHNDLSMLRKEAIIHGGIEDAAIFMSRIRELQILQEFLIHKNFPKDTSLNNNVLPDIVKENGPLKNEYSQFMAQKLGLDGDDYEYNEENENPNNLLNIVRAQELKKCQEVEKEIKEKKSRLISLAEELIKSDDQALEKENIKIGIVEGVKLKVADKKYFCAFGKEAKIYNIFLLEENNQCKSIIEHDEAIKDFENQKEKNPLV